MSPADIALDFSEASLPKNRYIAPRTSKALVPSIGALR